MGIVQGSGVDTHLNDFGRRQAEAFFATYGDVPFDRVYTSSLKRSQESVRAFLERGIPHQAFAGLNEINWGKKEGQTISPEEDQYYHYLLSQWREGNTSLAIEGGESPDDVTRRLIPVVDHIRNQVAEKTVLVCMHGRAMRILLCYLTKRPLQDMDAFEHTNLCLYLLTYHDGAFHIERSNDTDHLRSLI